MFLNNDQYFWSYATFLFKVWHSRFEDCRCNAVILVFTLFIIILSINIIYLMLTFVTYKWIINNLANTMIIKITAKISIANLTQPIALI